MSGEIIYVMNFIIYIIYINTICTKETRNVTHLVINDSNKKHQIDGGGGGDETTPDVYAEQKHGTMEATKCKSRCFPPGVAPG
jgi:hypothetical protein